jgi:hypothetical protein
VRKRELRTINRGGLPNAYEYMNELTYFGNEEESAEEEKRGTESNG